MATDPPGDVVLAPLTGEPRPIEDWLTTFHLVMVVLDPFTYESAWLLDSAGRMLRTYAGANCRTALLVTGTAAEATQFLGPWTEQLLCFADPERAFVRATGLERLPALVHLDQSGRLVGSAEGWAPDAWRPVLEHLSRLMSWSRPAIPAPGDPAPYEGSPALA